MNNVSTQEIVQLLKDCQDFICRWDDLDEGEIEMAKKINDMVEKLTQRGVIP